MALHGHAASAFGSLSQVVFSPAMVLRRMVHHIREEDVKDIIVPSPVVQMGLTPVPKQHYFGKPPKVWLSLHQPKDVKKVRYWIERWEKKKYVMGNWHFRKSMIPLEALKIWPDKFYDYWIPDGCENFERKPKGYERRFV